MKKLIAFILWPTFAGLVFALTLLQAPRLVTLMPWLAAYIFPEPVVQVLSPPVQFSYSEAIRNAAPAVVSINYLQSVQRTERVYLNRNSYVPVDYWDDSNSLGSGVIISPDGYIITSYHVVFNAEFEDKLPLESAITVTLNDGRNLEARLVSLDEKNDLALLKVDAEDLPYLTLADTSQLLVGDVVLAIGNPRNIGQSVSFGIISALWGRDDSFMIQTDAAINPGNSGGALINIDGNLIGINSTIVSESGGSEGISFSIPADLGINLLEQYLASGPSGYLGVDTEVLTLADGRQRFNLDIQGFQVNHVISNSPADKAGIRVGDIISGVDDNKLMIRNPEDEAEARAAMAAISNKEPGALIMVEVFREGSFLQLPAILGVGEPVVYGVPELVEQEESAPAGLPLLSEPVN